MARRIYISAVPGLTIALQLYDGATPVGSSIPTTEVGATGEYFGLVPLTVPAGSYLVIATAGAEKIASGEVHWNGFDVIDMTKLDEIHKIQGLDQHTPMVATPTSRVAGDISLEVDGYGSSQTTVTRQ